MASLLVPHLPARVAGVGQDGTNGGLRPPPVAGGSMGVARRVVAGGGEDAVAVEACGDEV
jgi:hypothetical protein